LRARIGAGVISASMISDVENARGLAIFYDRYQ